MSEPVKRHRPCPYCLVRGGFNGSEMVCSDSGCQCHRRIDNKPDLCGESVRLNEYGTCANPKPCPLHDDDAPAPTYTVTQASTSAIAELCLKCKHTRFWHTGAPAKLCKEPTCRCTCVWAESEPSEPPAEPQPYTPEESRLSAAWHDDDAGECRDRKRRGLPPIGTCADDHRIAATLRAYADQCEELERVEHACVVWKARDEAWYSDIHAIAGALHPGAIMYYGKSTLLDMLGSGIARLRERIAELEKR